ncbi:hypothetical protein LOK49_LG04G01362 [Camellia lanceoleosa]|uniref:Uncharacterized protein n=1 Tax=Camellia lanceoleosa TaxID=1840588 RepID=A0ACC0HY53_9ERIC|nr:hypothetical protein LOK49_LG04G01362 [Camellia lanceoleosa]
MLISEDMSEGPNTRRNVPSVVARLMGIDMLSFDTKSVARQDGKKNHKPGTNLHKKEQNKKGSGGHVHCNSNSSRQMEFNSFQHNKDKDPDSQHVHTKLKKPRSREHPQEEELQKFKKEFEAYQAARIRECSKVVELDRIPSQWLAQEALNRENVALYSNSRRITASEKPIDFMGHAVKASPCEKNQKPGTNFHKKEQNKKGSGGHVHCNSNSSRQMEFNSFQHNKDKDPDSQHVHTKLKKPRSREHPQEEELQKFKKEFEACQAARIRECSKVVELDRIPSQWLAQEALNKEKVALYSNSRRITASEKPIDFMGHAVKASPCESGLQHHGFKKELFPSKQKESYSSRNQTLIRDFEQPSLINSDQKLDTSCAPTIRDLTPRSLIRSMSAPASSGTSFGKVLLEDRHILTGAQIRRKHEVVERVTVDVRKRKKERSNLKEKVSSLKYSFSLRGSLFGRKILSAGSLFGRKRKKERFNLKEKVSSLKYSFSLRGSLFGKKILSAEEPHKYECDSMKDIMSGPTVMLNFGEAHENFTEVPPSPASVCSSVYEELWRTADHFSSTSTSDLSPLEDVLLPQVFREISSNLNELPRQLNELDADGPKETVTEEQPLETEMAELEDEAEAYIRDLLVASGLYDGSSDNVLSRWDPLAKPIITNDIFEAVEESYKKMTKDNEGSRRDHKLLFDLLNEALSVVLGPPVTMSTFRKAIGPALLPPRGQKLLDRAWEIVHAHLYPPTDKFHYSVADMVAEDLDLGFTTWSGLMNDEIDAVGKEIESQITGYLIEEIVKDMQSHNGV